MKTVKVKSDFDTQISTDDEKILGRLIDVLGPIVTCDPIGRYASMSSNDLWMTLVGQICVMGSAQLIERLTNDTDRYEEFEKAISLSIVVDQQNQAEYLAETLQQYSATRFYQKGAASLVEILNSPTCFQNGNIVLLDGLSHKDNFGQIREKLIRRCPVFGLKSASDFIITIGLSHNVIALDTRVVGFFKKYLDYNIGSNRVQSNRKVYFSVEQALREFCQRKNVSLALLDRLLFNMSNLSAIELVVKYPELISS